MASGLPSVSYSKALAGKNHLDNLVPLEYRSERTHVFRMNNLEPDKLVPYLETLQDVFGVDDDRFKGIVRQLSFVQFSSDSEYDLFEFSLGTTCKARMGYVVVEKRGGKFLVGHAIHQVESKRALPSASGGISFSVLGFRFSLFGNNNNNNHVTTSVYEAIEEYMKEKALLTLTDRGMIPAITYKD